MFFMKNLLTVLFPGFYKRKSGNPKRLNSVIVRRLIKPTQKFLQKYFQFNTCSVCSVYWMTMWWARWKGLAKILKFSCLLYGAEQFQFMINDQHNIINFNEHINILFNTQWLQEFLNKILCEWIIEFIRQQRISCPFV